MSDSKSARLPVAGQIAPPLGPGMPSTAGADFLTTKLDWLVQWGQSNSLWPMPFGTACCAIEFMASAASNYDLARFGMERMAFSPRQSARSWTIATHQSENGGMNCHLSLG